MFLIQSEDSNTLLIFVISSDDLSFIESVTSLHRIRDSPLPMNGQLSHDVADDSPWFDNALTCLRSQVRNKYLSAAGLEASEVRPAVYLLQPSRHEEEESRL